MDAAFQYLIVRENTEGFYADRAAYFSATTAVTSISSSIPGIASALMTRKVFAGMGPSLP